MSWKTNILVGTTVLGMATATNEMLSVKTPDDYKRYRQQQIVEQGGDAVEIDNQRWRDDLPGGVDAHRPRRLPQAPELRLKIRP